MSRLNEVAESIEDVREARDAYRGQLKHLAALCGIAHARLSEPVTKKDIDFARECTEAGLWVSRQLLEEDVRNLAREIPRELLPKSIRPAVRAGGEK